MFKLIYKNINESSFKAIKEFQKKNNISKIGHTGTLDPLAQGLLLVAIDDYTKLIPYIIDKDKEYKVIAKLGFISKTYDAEGPISYFSDKVPTQEEIEQCIKSFIGQIKQYPPIFSAKKINGKRSYQLARNNQDVKLNASIVNIYEIKNVKYQYPYLKFTTKVSNGTYIRSLIHDLGQFLKTGAYITYLERTMINGLRANDSIDIEKLLNLKITSIENETMVKNLLNGKHININLNDNTYLLEYRYVIIGLIVVKNKKTIKSKLFGKTIQEIIGD